MVILTRKEAKEIVGSRKEIPFLEDISTQEVVLRYPKNCLYNITKLKGTIYI